MRSLRLRRDLGLQVLALYLIFVGLVVLSTLLFENYANQRLQADVQAADLALARAIAQETSSFTGNALTAVANLSAYPAVLSGDPAGMGAVFHTLLDARRDVNLAYRLDENGIMRFHYPIEPNSTVGTDFSFRDYFQRALTADGPILSKGRVSPTTNQAVATAVMPLRDADGRFLGVVGTNLRLETLSQTLSSIAGEYPSQEGLSILIVDDAGLIIAHTDARLMLSDATRTMPQVITAVLNNATGNLVDSGPDGEEMLYSYVPIPNAGWGVVVSRPTAVAFASPSIFRRGALLAIGVFLFGGIIFWLIFSERVLRPIERLAYFSQTVGLEDAFNENHRSNLAALTSRPDQMGLLTRSMTEMQQAIEARLNELSTLLETGQAVVSSLDSATVLDNILAQVERLLDVNMSAIFAHDSERNIFRVRASRNLPGWYIEQAVINPSDPSSITMRTIRSGQPIQISDTETNPSFKTHRDRARRAGYRSVMAVPLSTQHAPPAALLVFRPDPHEFSHREANLLSSFATQAAMAIENAALFARSDMRLQEQTRRLEALIQSMQDGLILENLEGRVIYANRRIAELTGQPPEQIQQAPVVDVMARLLARAPNAQEAETAVSSALQPAGPHKATLTLAYPERTIILRLKVFEVTDSQGLPLGRGRILQDITQRQELDRMKSSLIATVSHELRTPLAAIKGYASTLLADDVQWDAVSQREFLEIISQESDHLNNLVNDLLDMSRLEAGNLTVNRIACDLGELVAQAALHAHPQPGKRLVVDLPPDLPPIYADPRRIEAVLRNLIENAAKYGGETGHIWLTAVVEPARLVVSVRDEGPGIDPHFADRVFNSFYRIENGLTRSASGVGLGLSIARGFVRLHGGSIWVADSQRGACLAFSLPLETRPDAAVPEFTALSDG
ncbi:MAG: GAF domain-containing protein [Ardenticatenaceae bacterium]|nr:GAF domain-containing protein [Ardenticatenaceae bacterium]MCB8986943.1 GAF domain-containing protein [Ardenticatenaceae bacterium]